MAKNNNQKYQRSGIEGEQQRIGGEYDTFLNQFLGRSSTPSGSGGYNPNAPLTNVRQVSGNPSNSLRDLMFGRGGTGTSAGAPVIDKTTGLPLGQSPRYNEILKEGKEERGYLKSGLQDFATTGGLDDATIENYRNAYRGALGGGPASANLTDFTEERNRYRDFADTGGYSNPDIQRIRAQAARSSPEFYRALQDQQNLASSRMGANIGGSSGLDLKLARQAAQGAAGDKLAANIGLAESQRTGKQFGIQGLESTGTEMGRQSLEQAGLTNQYNLGAADLTSRAEGDIIDLRQRGRESGLRGLQDLYGSNYGPQTDFEKTWLDAIGGMGDATRGNRSLNIQNDAVGKQPGFWGNIGDWLGAAAGGIKGLANRNKNTGGQTIPPGMDVGPYQGGGGTTIPIGGGPRNEVDGRIGSRARIGSRSRSY